MDARDVFREFRRRSGYSGTCPPLRVECSRIGFRLWKDRPGLGTTLLAAVTWEAVTQICFKDNGPMRSDMIYVCMSDRPGILAIPLEIPGGGVLWRQFRTRGLIPASLHEQATLATDGALYCWPPLEGAAAPRDGNPEIR